MNRSFKRGALFVAPLVIASTMFGASTSAAHPVYGIDMQVDAICTDIATKQAVYAFENKNAFSVNVNWVNYDTVTKGSFTVAPNSFHGSPDKVQNPGPTPGYATDYNPSHPNNRTAFFYEDGLKINEQNARVSEVCPPALVPAKPAIGGNGGGTTTPVTPVTPPTTTTPVAVGGRGGETASVKTATPVAAANTAATLANTGAEQIVPLAAAAMIAVAILGTTVAVRKNVL